MSSSQPGAIERLAAQVAAVRIESIDRRAIDRAKLLVLDTLGCGFAALDDECGRAVMGRSTRSEGSPHCTVLGNPAQDERAECRAR